MRIAIFRHFVFLVNKYIDHFCWSTIGNQHMRLIERLPYALCRFHTRSFILHSNVRFMMRIECASNMVNAFGGGLKLYNKDLILSKIRLLLGVSRLDSHNLWPERHCLMLFNFHYLRENIYVFSTCKK
jgi:hypothetical protein